MIRHFFRFDLIVMTREDGLLSEEFCQNYLKDGGKIVKTYPQRINSDSYGFLRRYLLSYLRKIVAPYHSLDVTPLGKVFFYEHGLLNLINPDIMIIY